MGSVFTHALVFPLVVTQSMNLGSHHPCPAPQEDPVNTIKKQEDLRNTAIERLNLRLSKLDHSVTIPVESTCSKVQDLKFRVLDRGNQILTFSHGTDSLKRAGSGGTRNLFEQGSLLIETSTERNFYSPPRIYPLNNLKDAKYSGVREKRTLEPFEQFGDHYYQDTEYDLSDSSQKDLSSKLKKGQTPLKSMQALGSLYLVSDVVEFPKSKNAPGKQLIPSIGFLSASFTSTENHHSKYSTAEEYWAPNLGQGGRESRFSRFIRKIFRIRKNSQKKDPNKYVNTVFDSYTVSIENNADLVGNPSQKRPIDLIVKKVPKDGLKEDSKTSQANHQYFRREALPVYDDKDQFVEANIIDHPTKQIPGGFDQPVVSKRQPLKWVESYQWKNSSGLGQGAVALTAIDDTRALNPLNHSVQIDLSSQLGSGTFKLIHEDVKTGNLIARIDENIGKEKSTRWISIDTSSKSIAEIPGSKEAFKNQSLSFYDSDREGQTILVAENALGERSLKILDTKTGGLSQGPSFPPASSKLPTYQDPDTQVIYIQSNRDGESPSYSLVNKDGTLSKQKIQLEDGEELVSLASSLDPETGEIYTEAMVAKRDPFTLSRKSFGPASSGAVSSKAFPQLAKALLRDARMDALKADAFNPCIQRSYKNEKRKASPVEKEEKKDTVPKVVSTLYPNPFGDKTNLKIEDIPDNVLDSLDLSGPSEVFFVDSFGNTKLSTEVEFDRVSNGPSKRLLQSRDISTAGLPKGKYIMLVRDPTGKAHQIHCYKE